MLDSTFFDRSAEDIAHDLIGCRLNWRGGEQSGPRIITETEAYTGPDDLASHASKGRTKRNEAMFGPPGSFYVYFVYGLHWMLNIVTGPIGYPAAVLIRGVEGIVGPARLTKALGITGHLNGKVASKATGIWFRVCTQLRGCDSILQEEELNHERIILVERRGKRQVIEGQCRQ